MAVYKVIQDIESEDKLLGPLTLKGLVYAAVVVTFGFIDFKLLLSGVGTFKWIILPLTLPPMLLFGLLASPIGREQPSEVWLMSRLRFFLKPRARIWNQSGLTNLVTITVPKKVVKQLTKNFSETEVTSRLQALATTLDSRGWAVKNVNVNLNALPNYLSDQQSGSDRLVGVTGLGQEVPLTDIHASDDMLDEQNNPTAQNFQNLMTEADNLRRQAVLEKLNTARTAMGAPAQEETPEHGHEEKIHDLKPIFKMGIAPPKQSEVQAASGLPQAMTEAKQAAKLELAQSGNDLSVASIAKLANRGAPGEVVIALH